MTTIKECVAEAVAQAAAASFGDVSISPVDIAAMLEYPPDPKMGDLALPCFKLSKVLHSAPQKIAADIAETFDCPVIASANVLGGYLNFSVSPDHYTKTVLNEIIEKGDDYGSSAEGNGKTVVLDYSSPNVAKPFHIGHLGTTVIGHSLKMLYERLGYKCIGVNHLGDWGTQFGKLIVAFRNWGSAEAVEKNGIDELVELYVKFHEEAEKDPTLEDKARDEFTKLEHGDEDNRRLWKWFIDLSIVEYKKTYRQLGIEFDSYMGESFYYDKTAPIVEELKEKNLLKIDDGASIVSLDDYGMPPCLILKKDGSTIYAVRDIAAAMYRKKTYDFSKCIYVTSSGQSLHFAQFFKVIELMGRDWAKDLVHVPYGTVSINGSKLATRTGNVILLRDLFATAINKVKEIMDEKNPDLENKDDIAEAVGVGAIVFHYLSNSRIKDINFVIEDALNFDGNTGPYCQYTYARCCSIISKAGDLPEYKGENKPNETELALLKTLSMFPEKIHDAARDYEPMVIARFILDCAGAFNRFYHECQIITADDPDTRAFRLRLTSAAKTVIGSAFGLICMKKTERI